MVLIAIDPGTKKSGVAVFSKGELVKYMKVKSTPHTIEKLFKTASEKSEDGFLLAIEDQYGGFNFKTTKHLSSVSGGIAWVSILCGCQGVYLINPNSWHTILQENKEKLLRREKKKKAKIKASQIANKKIDDSDIADAICIGLYVLQNYDKLAILEDIA